MFLWNNFICKGCCTKWWIVVFTKITFVGQYFEAERWIRVWTQKSSRLKVLCRYTLEKLQQSLQLQNSSRKASYMLNFFQVNFRGHEKVTLGLWVLNSWQEVLQVWLGAHCAREDMNNGLEQKGNRACFWDRQQAVETKGCTRAFWYVRDWVEWEGYVDGCIGERRQKRRRTKEKWREERGRGLSMSRWGLVDCVEEVWSEKDWLHDGESVEPARTNERDKWEVEWKGGLEIHFCEGR